MVRSVLSIVAGFLATAILVMLTIYVIGLIFPEEYGPDTMQPTLGWMLLNVAYSSLYAILGGHLTARIAGQSEIKHATILGALMLLMGLAEMLAVTFGDMGGELADPRPLWYLLAVPILALPSAVFGGYIRAKGKRTI